MLSGPAFTACCIELSDGVLGTVAYFVGDVVWVPYDVCEVFDLHSFNGVGQFFRIGVSVCPRVGL